MALASLYTSLSRADGRDPGHLNRSICVTRFRAV